MKTKMIATMVAIAFASTSHAARVADDAELLTASPDSTVIAEIKKCSEAGGIALSSGREGVICAGAVDSEFPAPKDWDRWVHAYVSLPDDETYNEQKKHNFEMLCSFLDAGAAQRLSFGRKSSIIFAKSHAPCRKKLTSRGVMEVSFLTTNKDVPENLSVSDMHNEDIERAVVGHIKRCADAGGLKLNLTREGDKVKSHCTAKLFSYPSKSVQHYAFEALREEFSGGKLQKLDELCSLPGYVKYVGFFSPNRDNGLKKECREKGLVLWLDYKYLYPWASDPKLLSWSW